MALQPTAADEIPYYLTMIELTDIPAFNQGLSSAKQSTMIAKLGSPVMPLTKEDQPDRASPQVKLLRVAELVSTHILVDGIRPAVSSLKDILAAAFKQEKDNGHDLESVLGTSGMLVVRLRNPTSGNPSANISNHSWGTAIDFKLVGHVPPANTGDKIPNFIAVLLPFFNQRGWYSGISFKDTMHFEIADGTIKQWADEGKFVTV